MAEYKFSCIVDTTYTLSLYLLYMSEEDINRTIFFVGNAIPSSVSDMLPHVVRIDNSIKRYNSRTKAFLRRVEAVFKWRFRHKTKFYAQDHLLYAPNLIGSHPYTLLEDAPNIYTLYKNIEFMRPIPPKNIVYKWKNIVIFGPIGLSILGTNPQCHSIMVTQENDLNSELLRGKRIIKVDMKELWNSSSPSKQESIKKIFGIDDSIFKMVKDCSVIIFTQPLIDDCDLTEEEMKEVYSSSIEKYKKDGIIIKPHPRDKFDYLKHFPEVSVLKTKAPMQLLGAMGLEFKIGITVCSSAVTAMPDNSEIIWLGAKVNPKVYKVYGDLQCPK